jgi:pectate lyase
MGQGGTVSPTGGAASGVSGAGANPQNGGVGGATPTGGVSGTGVGGTDAGTTGLGGAGGVTPTGGGAGTPGGAGSAGAGGGMGGTSGNAGIAGTAGTAGTTQCPLRPQGWAAIPGAGFNGPTTGGCDATPVTVNSLSALNTALTGFQAKVIRVEGTITGTVQMTANTTLEGVSGGRINGSIQIDGDINVIVRNLVVVGNNCSDASNCEDGADAIAINGASHHVWVDHCDISNGSDGNLDVVDASDFVTISWTKFSYSGTSRDHRYSNLIGDDDNATADAGKLGVTYHHCWWADRVQERMPRVRYGRVHLFNNLWTASGNEQCVQLGTNGNIRMENNVFIGVDNPINTTDYNPGSGSVSQTGNVYASTSGSTATRGTAWTPSSITGYTYTLEPTSGLETAVRNGARPQ